MHTQQITKTIFFPQFYVLHFVSSFILKTQELLQEERHQAFYLYSVDCRSLNGS